MSGTWMAEELYDQPAAWSRALTLSVPEDAVPQQGEKVAVIGCGSSWFGAQAFAALRESLGQGETSAFTASEFPHGRSFDRVVAISRSGTTTEVLDVVRRLAGSTPITAVLATPGTALAQEADHPVVLDFADERSVVQTRFATTAIMLLRTWLGQQESVAAAIRQAETFLAAFSADLESWDPAVLPEALLDAEQYSFLGMGWAWGVAEEAALKLRECAQWWTESYSSMEYRHGPIAIATSGRVTWQLGRAPQGLAEEVRATGARFVESADDPVAELVKVHVLALIKARRHGLDPDSPRSLSRSVVLD